MKQSRLMRFALPSALLAAAANAPVISSAIAAELTQEALYGRQVIVQPAASGVVSTTTVSSGTNPFNRLMKAPQRRHLPPLEDEIHDPANQGTALLQPPQEAFADLPKTKSDIGNGVDWVAAATAGKIKPRWVYNNPAPVPMTMNMAAVRVHKGSLPDVVFRHRQHTEQLFCSDCHPDIFVAQNGANQILMSGIMLGQKCGVCHGKVAFPIADCNRCHSQPKAAAAR